MKREKKWQRSAAILHRLWICVLNEYFKIGLLLVGVALTGPILANKAEDYSLGWSDYTRGFRRNHNLGLTSFYTRSRWRIQTDFKDQNVDETLLTQGTMVKLEYAYHLPLFQSFGYLLGSSLGFERVWLARSQVADIGNIYHLPGIWGCGVYDFSLNSRVLVGVDAYFQYVDNLVLKQTDPSISLAISLMTLVDSMVIWDIFYNLQTGIRLEYHVRWADYVPPLNSEHSVLGGNLEKYDTNLGIGLIYHFL